MKTKALIGNMTNEGSSVRTYIPAEGSKAWAIRSAKELARLWGHPTAVARLSKRNAGFCTLSGVIDRDSEELKQLLIVTPDGRLWRPVK